MRLRLAKKKIPIMLDQWNVRGLNKIDKLQILSKVLEGYNLMVVGLSEVKWKGTGHFRTADNHLILYGGSEQGREHHGVAFWIHQKVASYLIEYNVINNRIITATFKATPKNLSIIQCYAPTQDKDEEIADAFYGDLSRTIGLVPKKNVLCVMGDFNARVGENAYESPVISKYGYGSRDEAGQRLIDFCGDHKLILTNTMFRHHMR